MKLFFHILPFEWKSLWRNNTLKVLLLVVIGTGIYGIYFGQAEIDKQQAKIEEVQQYERQQFDSLLVWAKLDTSIDLHKDYYLQAVSPTGVGWSKHFTYYLTHDAHPLAGLCLGQRDLYPGYYGVNVTDLARQLNVGELANPMKLLTGNFDLSYVLVFLLPLLIIAIFHNLYAGEKEEETLALLQAQPVSFGGILFSKGLLRLLIVWAIATILLVLGFVLQGVPIGSNLGAFFQWLLIIYAYCLFWVIVMAGVVALRKGTALSAMLGLGIWLILTLVSPAILNLIVSSSTPLPNRAELIHVVRNLNDKTWEQPKSYVFDQFYSDYPQFNDGDTANFDKWYYASFTLLDKEANEMKVRFEEEVRHRNAFLQGWRWVAPAAWMHEELATLARTDRDSHVRFVSQIYDTHEKLKEVYYEKIFSEEYFSMQDLGNLETLLAK